MTEERVNEIVSSYIEFIQESWKKYKGMGEVISNTGEISYTKVNTALANVYQISQMVHAEYRRHKMIYRTLESSYKIWEAQKLVEAKTAVLAEYQSSRSIKPSVKEFESYMRVRNADEWIEWDIKMIEAEEKVKFFLRVQSDLDKNVDILRTLSSNMRSEMRNLNLDMSMQEDLNPVENRPPQRVPV